MIRERVTIQDYNRISKENEYFIWNFISKEDIQILIFSFFKENEERHDMKEILKYIDIPYYESYIDENSIDFLINLGIDSNMLWKKDMALNSVFHPLLISFNKRAKVKSTFDFCYCKEGILDLILDLNPKFILDSKLD